MDVSPRTPNSSALRPVIRLLGLAATAYFALLLVGSAAQAARVRVGSTPPRPRGARVVGTLTGSTEMHLTVALQPRDPAGLASYAQGVADPASPLYRHYLSVGQFARRFGAAPVSVAAVRSALAGEGLSVGALSANHLSLAVHDDADTVAEAFSTRFERLTTASGDSDYRNTTAPEVPQSVAGDIQAIGGLDTVDRPQPLLARGRHAAAASATGAAACSTASDALWQFGAGPLPIDQVAHAYGFGGLYGGGDLGAGVTVGLFELEGNFPTDISAYQQCFGTNAAVSYSEVDGGPPAPSTYNQDGMETELDADNVIGLAPDANVTIFQGPDTGAGALDTYQAMIAGTDRPEVISVSWGDCEAHLGRSVAAAEATLFQEAATQGQTIVAAAGDSGAQDCWPSQSSTAPAVDDPASSPYVTGVGGTAISSASPLSETVWNDGAQGIGAGGGGDSAFWTMPAYQSGAAAELGVINGASSAATCGAPPGGHCREVPDVAADAEPSTGYLVYWGGDGTPTDTSAWTVVGGTSGAAPLWAALFALADAHGSCTTTPVGMANPALYTLADLNQSAYFSDVTAGNNDLLGTNAGRYAATTGYDQATGLGTPKATALVSALCPSSATTVTLSDPGSQSALAGRATSLQLLASDSDSSQALTYTASGLPPGMKLAAATGLISGTPTTAGTYTATVRAADATGSQATRTLTWLVGANTLTFATPAAQTSHVGHASSLQLSASDVAGAPITYSASSLPSGLALNAATGRISGTPGQASVRTVTVTASTVGAPALSHRLTWTVAGNPTVSGQTLHRVGQRVSLSLTTHAGPDAPAIRQVSIQLPATLSVTSSLTRLRSATTVRGANGRALAATITRSGRTIVVRLANPATTATIGVSTAALAVTTGSRLAGTARLALTVADAKGWATHLSPVVPVR